MYGWRAKLGFIVPANNTVIEPELYSVVPQGISLHFTKLDLRRTDFEQVDKGAAVKLLSYSGVDVIVYACMSGSLVEADTWESTTFAETQIRALSATSALMNAISAIKVKKIAIATHYPETRLAQVRDWFQRHGLKVVAVETAALLDPRAVCEIPTEVVYRLARKANSKDADCLCLLATDLSTFPIIQQLENDIGKPVITSNQTLLWRAMRMVGITQPMNSCGLLFDH